MGQGDQEAIWDRKEREKRRDPVYTLGTVRLAYFVWGGCLCQEVVARSVKLRAPAATAQISSCGLVLGSVSSDQ